MSLFIAFLACVVAGFVNGSYAFPVKYMERISKETAWFYFSFFGFFVVPLISMIVIAPDAFSVISHVDLNYILALVGGGFIFGIGMVLFTLCLNKIGLGIAFILNISLGTIGGSLLPLFLFHQNVFFTAFGLANFAALVMFIIAVSVTSHAVHIRDVSKNKLQEKPHKNTFLGLLLGILSGLFCSMQGFSYAYSLPAFKSSAVILGISEYGAINIPWIIIFSSALIPYALFQLYLQNKKHTFVNIFKREYAQYWKWIILMGILYFSSILIYSRAVLNLGTYGQIIAWPLFMIFIILSSNFWSVIHGEWLNSSRKSKIIFFIGILFIIFAILLLGYASAIRNG